jgi:hypothetical protein
MQDPTDQAGIDNYMVHDLDGTQNEWGWPKAKVLLLCQGLQKEMGMVYLDQKQIACMQIRLSFSACQLISKP